MEQENIIPVLVDRVREGKIQRRHLIKTLTALGISAGGVNAIVASTTRPGATQAATATSNEDTAQHLQLHQQHITNQGQGNLAALASDYADNAIVEDPMVPVPVVGRAAIIARKTTNTSAVTGGQITVLQRIAQGNQVMVEWEATGLHTGDLPGLPATNRPYVVRGVTVVVRENGKIVRESLYYDLADLQHHKKREMAAAGGTRGQTMRQPQNIVYICMCITLLSLLISGCGSNVFTSSATPTATPRPEQIFTTAFPPTTPLVCPGTSTTGSSFVTTTNGQFMYQGKPLKLYGYTFYPTSEGGASAWHQTSFTNYIDQILNTGAQAGQNVLRPTDFWDTTYYDRRQDDITIWHNMDYLVCAAARRGVFLDLDVSAFQWFLVSQHHDKYDLANWKAFLDAVGKHYANQPSIAFYSIIGEPDPPKNVAAMNDLVNFYRSVTNELHQADEGHHLISAGGFNHMEDETAQMPWWQEIYSLPNNNVPAFKTYSQQDLQLIPTITAFTRQLGKPAFDEEFGMPQYVGDGTYSGQQYNDIQSSRAQFYNDVYTQGEQNGVAGFVFWSLGCGSKPSDFDVSPNDNPAVWQVIQQHAPDALETSAQPGLSC